MIRLFLWNHQTILRTHESKTRESHEKYAIPTLTQGRGLHQGQFKESTINAHKP